MTSRRVLVPLAFIVAISSPMRAASHRLVTDRFYNTFSFAHPPVLRIKPGDRVITKTIDAAGADWEGRSVGVRPNPQTGPFHVEGAEPGVLLVVSIERIETNRPTGFSASV